MSNGSAIFKVIASLVWGIGTLIVVLSIKADGAQSGWTELLFCLGLLGLLQGFSFVSFIMSVFHQGADEAINTVEEKIWVDRFGQVVHRESDAGSGCIVALVFWIVGILLTLLASALIAPIIFVVNLCRATHHFVPRKKIAVILDVLIVCVTIAGVAWGYGIADRAIQEREAKRRAAAAQYAREAAEKKEQAQRELQAQQERERQEQAARALKMKLEFEAQEAARKAEKQRRDAERQAEREAKKQEAQARKAAEAQKRALRQAEQKAERERKEAERKAKREMKKLKKTLGR